jgi:hypothetical protein
MDLPGPSLDMIKRFINDESFADVPLPSEGNLLYSRTSIRFDTLSIAFYSTLLVDESQDSLGIDDTVTGFNEQGSSVPTTPSSQIILNQQPPSPPNSESAQAKASSSASLLMNGAVNGKKS